MDLWGLRPNHSDPQSSTLPAQLKAACPGLVAHKMGVQTVAYVVCTLHILRTAAPRLAFVEEVRQAQGT
eukprot:5721718-Amphidinium_carterae.1